MKTLSQATMQQALDLVREVVGKPEQVRTIYGNLCHEFPVLVRTCGLCQAIAVVTPPSNDSWYNQGRR